MTYKFDCFWFSGYKPCQFKRACEGCTNYRQVNKRIVVVSLEAMGAVLRSTCLLPAIRRKYPDSHITWITYKNAKPLLDNNPLIDRTITVSEKTQALFHHLEFDVLYAVDKSFEAGALSEIINAKEKFGFGLTKQGAIRPFTKDADYQFEVGLDDDLKFYENEKPETQQITESMGLEWVRDPYVLMLTEKEKAIVAERRKMILGSYKGVIGYNTGCSLLFPNKKLTVKRSIEIIAAWRKEFPDYVVALYGGPEDTERQAQMKEAFMDDPQVVNTPTTGGLRSGILWEDTADLVLSGCSLGMHIAIGLGKKVIAWFGVSCLQEVDVYDRGVQIQSEVGCSPCWRKQCNEDPMCYDMVPVEKIMDATKKLLLT